VNCHDLQVRHGRHWVELEHWLVLQLLELRTATSTSAGELLRSGLLNFYSFAAYRQLSNGEKVVALREILTIRNSRDKLYCHLDKLRDYPFSKSS